MIIAAGTTDWETDRQTNSLYNDVQYLAGLARGLINHWKMEHRNPVLLNKVHF